MTEPIPELGSKHECAGCGTKFYDLGKDEPVCPKCGLNQLSEEGAEAAAANEAKGKAKRKSKAKKKPAKKKPAKKKPAAKKKKKDADAGDGEEE